MIIFGHRKENWTPAFAGETKNNRFRQAVLPANAGIQKVFKAECEDWTPAYAGETAITKVHK